jgi:hypothetical protein
MAAHEATFDTARITGSSAHDLPCEIFAKNSHFPSADGLGKFVIIS